MIEIRHEIRAAARLLWQRPGFTMLAGLILALGIGGCTALFGIMNGVLLRPLPYADAERIVIVEQHTQADRTGPGRLSWPDYIELTEAGLPFESMSGYLHMPGTIYANLGAGSEVYRLPVAYVSGSFFATLGIDAARGQVIQPEHDVPESDAVIVLSDATWRRNFGGDPTITGRTVTIDNAPYTVIGIAPPQMQFPAREIAAWLPLSLIDENSAPHVRGNPFVSVIGRLDDGAAAAAATAGIERQFASAAERFPETNADFTAAVVRPLREVVLGDVTRPIAILMAAMVIVLLVGSANVANLLLTRVTGRSVEFAVRAALGAGVWRLARQLLIENLLLALLGVTGGLLLAIWSLDIFVRVAGERIPRSELIGIDGTVLLFALALTAFTAFLTGVLPAWRAARTEVQQTLRAGRGAGESRASLRSRGILVMVETALAVCLLIGSVLMIRSFVNLLRIDPGFDRTSVVTFGITIPSDIEDTGAYRSALLERLRDIPGVDAAAGSKTTPLQGGGEPMRMEYQLADGTTRTFEPPSGVYFVSPDYFRTLGIDVLAGSEYARTPQPGDVIPFIINRSAAQHLWPAGSALGNRVSAYGTPAEIAAVVDDVRSTGIDTPAEPAFYLLWDYAPRSSAKYFLRTSRPPESLYEPVRTAIREYDAGLPVPTVTTMGALVSEQLSTPRLLTILIGIFGAVALLLAALGLYAVIAYTVAQRTHEIGIRMVLGARRTQVIGLVLGQALAVTAIGIAIGIAAALAGTRLMQSLLYGVAPSDPLSFVIVPVLLLVVAAGASLVPALRASAVEPASAFRRG